MIGHIVHLEGCTSRTGRWSPTGRSCCTVGRRHRRHRRRQRRRALRRRRAARRPGRRRPGDDQAGRARMDEITAASRSTSPAGRAVPARRCAGSTDVLALVVTVPAGEAELASDALWALGVAAIEERLERRRRTTTRRAVDVARRRSSKRSTRRRRGVPGALAVAHGRARPSRRRELAAHAGADRGSTPTSSIVPAWLDESSTPAGVLPIDIDPGAAFGSATTRRRILTLRLLRASRSWPGPARARRRLRQRRARDRRRPAGAPYVAAIDISPAAVEATDGQRHAQRRRRRRQRQHDAPGRDRRERSTSCSPTCWRPCWSTWRPTCAG